MTTDKPSSLWPKLRLGARRSIGVAFPSSLTFENISLSFGDLAVLRDVSLHMEPGEVVCLLGQSGCGKTTLLRIAAGIELPDQGRVLLNGKEVTGPSVFLAPEKRGVGMMFQDYALFPHMSVKENVLFGLRGLSKTDADGAAMRALTRVGMENYAATSPSFLSGGEQQRVALARSIAPRPGILLMDEPFSNLDRRLRDSVRDDTIAILRETGATAIVVTHDPEEAMRIADRIVLMKDGSIVQHGPSASMYKNPVDIFAARFFCDFNEIEAKVVRGHVETPIGTFKAPDFVDGASVVVAVRPQGLSLRPPGCSLPGRLLSSHFLGEVESIEVAVAGLDKPLQGRIRGGYQAGEGDDVGVEIDATEVLVFAASGS
jgi:iron(III) transport system ATP-binding protein